MRNAMFKTSLSVAVPLILAVMAGPAIALDVAIWAEDDVYIADVVAKVTAAGAFDSVTSRNILAQGLPTLAETLDYDAVMIFGGHNQFSSSLRTDAGNLLAQYADQGGGVLTATFVLGSNLGSWILGGQWADERYHVMVPVSSQSQGTELTLGTVYQPGHPIMSGVSSFSGGSASFRADITSFASGHQRIADWSNGAPLIATKELPDLGRRVDLNFYPPSNGVRSDFWRVGTDGDVIMVNALAWAAVPEPASLTLLGLGLLSVGLIGRWRKR